MRERFGDRDNDRTFLQEITNRLVTLMIQLKQTSDPKERNNILEKMQVEIDGFKKTFDEFYEAAREMKRGVDKLAETQLALQEAREVIEALREEIDKLMSPPSLYGIFISANDDGTVNIFSQGRKVKVNLHPSIKPKMLKPGQEVILNEGLNVIEMAHYGNHGEVVVVKDILDSERVLVILRADEERVGVLAESIRGTKLKIGDHIMMDMQSGYLLERLPKSEVEDLALEEVPDISYEDIGGLENQIEALRDAVELPYLYPELYKEHKLTPPKGVLLYGPPGCGKTMVAKAVAKNLADKASEKRGEKIEGYFLNIKGPELLNKYVGETERKVREVFLKAKEKANEDFPVVIFFDEMDALFRTRGSGISSDVESTIVPQLLAELDGVEGLKNIIVIGASNRQDLIDPAVLRPGRLDVKIKIDRPNALAAFKILGKYSKPGIPLHPAKFGPYPQCYETPNRLKTLLPKEWERLDADLSELRDSLGMTRKDIGRRKMEADEQKRKEVLARIDASEFPGKEKTEMKRCLDQQVWEYEVWEFKTEADAFNYLNYKTTEGIYIETPFRLVWIPTEGEPVELDTRFIELVYATGGEVVYYRDLFSGAMLESIVRRAKKRALKRFIETKVKGVMMVDYWFGAREEFKENEDLPNTTNPDDWAKILGRRQERILNVRTISSQKLLTLPKGAVSPRGTERVSTGQYL